MAKGKQRDLSGPTNLMAHASGRQWVWEYLSGCGLYSTSFSPEALSMAFREGERNSGLRMVADLIEANPDAYLLMLKEHSSGRTNTDADRSGNDGDDDTSASE